MNYIDAGAEIDGRYRYRLWRVWNADLPGIAFVMLNPSRADAHNDDATIRRCVGYAQAWGYGRLDVVNLFALRSPSPRDLLHDSAPTGDPRNLEILFEVARSSSRILCAWGNLPRRLTDRAAEVACALSSDRALHALSITKSGQPGHPVRLRRDLRPRLWRRAGDT